MATSGLSLEQILSNVSGSIATAISQLESWSQSGTYNNNDSTLNPQSILSILKDTDRKLRGIRSPRNDLDTANMRDSEFDLLLDEIDTQDTTSSTANQSETAIVNSQTTMANNEMLVSQHNNDNGKDKKSKHRFHWPHMKNKKNDKKDKHHNNKNNNNRNDRNNRNNMNNNNNNNNNNQRGRGRGRGRGGGRDDRGDRGHQGGHQGGQSGRGRGGGRGRGRGGHNSHGDRNGDHSRGRSRDRDRDRRDNNNHKRGKSKESRHGGKKYHQHDNKRSRSRRAEFTDKSELDSSVWKMMRNVFDYTNLQYNYAQQERIYLDWVKIEKQIVNDSNYNNHLVKIHSFKRYAQWRADVYLLHFPKYLRASFWPARDGVIGRLNPLKAVYNTIDEMNAKTDEMKQQLQQQQQQKKNQDKQNNQKNRRRNKKEKDHHGWTKYFRRGGRQVSSRISQRDLRRSTRTLSYGDVPDGEVTFDVSYDKYHTIYCGLGLIFSQLCHEWGLMKHPAKKKSFNGVNSTNDGKLAKPGGNNNNNNNNNYGKGRRYKRRFAVQGKKWHEKDTENIKHLGEAIPHFEKTVLLSLNKILGKNFDNEIIADRLNGEWTINHSNYLKIFQTKEQFNTLVDLIFLVDIEFEMMLFEKELTKYFKRWYNKTGGKPGKAKNNNNNNNMNRSKSKRKNNSKRCPPDEEASSPPPTPASAATSTTSIKSGSSSSGDSDSNDETDQSRPEIAIRHASSKEEFTKAWYDKYAEITKEVFSAQYILTYVVSRFAFLLGLPYHKLPTHKIMRLSFIQKYVKVLVYRTKNSRDPRSKEYGDTLMLVNKVQASEDQRKAERELKKQQKQQKQAAGAGPGPGGLGSSLESVGNLLVNTADAAVKASKQIVEQEEKEKQDKKQRNKSWWGLWKQFEVSTREIIDNIRNNGDYLKMWLEYGIFARIVKFSGSESESIGYFFNCKNWVHLRSNLTFITNKKNNTLLHMAALKGQRNFARLLCYFGADMDFIPITYSAIMLYTMKENKRKKHEAQQNKDRKTENKENKNKNKNKNKNYNKLPFDPSDITKSKMIPFDGESAYMVAKPNVKEIFDLLKDGSESRIKKNIQSKYWAVRLQAKMCDEFLKHLGCTKENADNISIMPEMGSMEHAQSCVKTAMKNGDKLWFDTRVKSVLSYDKACEVMDNIVDTVTRLLLWKLPISDDLLILSWRYCVLSGKHEQLLKPIQDTIFSSLADDEMCKKRHHFWFKTFLENSNIWYQSYIDETKRDDTILNVEDTIINPNTLTPGGTAVYDTPRLSEFPALSNAPEFAMELLQDENYSDVESNDENENENDNENENSLNQSNIAIENEVKLDHETSVSTFSDTASITDDPQAASIERQQILQAARTEVLLFDAIAENIQAHQLPITQYLKENIDKLEKSESERHCWYEIINYPELLVGGNPRQDYIYPETKTDATTVGLVVGNGNEDEPSSIRPVQGHDTDDEDSDGDGNEDENGDNDNESGSDDGSDLLSVGGTSEGGGSSNASGQSGIKSSSGNETIEHVEGAINLMENGTIPDYTEDELYKISSEIEEVEGTNVYDILQEYDFNSYLNKLILNAHSINGTFQADMQRFFEETCNIVKSKTNDDDEEGVPIVTFQSAPVKVADRCQIKAQTDYSDKPFPTSAQIVDIVRCSVTYNNCADMLDGMNYFCKCVSMSAREFHQMKLKAKYGDDYGNKKDDDKKDGSDAVTTEMKEYTEHEHDHHFHSLGQKLLSKKPISTGCVKKIVRIKNGFKKVPNWLDDSDYQYCDVKFNVVIEVNGNAVVGEIQFLLNWMLKAKTMGHKLYDVIRRNDFINNVMFLLRQTQDNINSANGQKIVEQLTVSSLSNLKDKTAANASQTLEDIIESAYQRKLESIIQTENETSLGKELLLNPCGILTMLNKVYLRRKRKIMLPIMSSICTRGWKKGLSLFMQFLFHFDALYGEFGVVKRDSNNSPFAHAYLNYPGSYSTNQIWGINTYGTKITSHGSDVSQVVAALLSCEFFEGIKDPSFVFDLCSEKYYRYLELIQQYRVNDEGIIDGINRYDESSGHTPMTVLVSSQHCTIGYIKLLASFPGFDVNAKSKNKEYMNMTAVEIADQRNKAIFKTILSKMGSHH